MSEKELIYQHMEAILVRLGQADMHCERLRMAAAVEENPVKKAGMDQMAELSARRLEMIASEAIELGRALAVRLQTGTPTVPAQIPEGIRNVDESAYKGAEGMPKDTDPSLLAYTNTSGSKAN